MNHAVLRMVSPHGHDHFMHRLFWPTHGLLGERTQRTLDTRFGSVGKLRTRMPEGSGGLWRFGSLERHIQCAFGSCVFRSLTERADFQFGDWHFRHISS